MRILGIESSCDETAASVVEDGKKLLSNVVASSMDLHEKYGGVVPEIAARSHIEAIIPVIEQALSDARCTWDDIDGIAVTYGAGLGGSLLVGVMTARTLAITKGKPLYAINHVEGHIYVNFLTEVSDQELVAQGQTQAASNIGLVNGKEYVLPTKQPVFPMLGLIVSGGHSQLVLWQDHFKYVLLGQTHDDAIGEAYDKVAKILGLPYPGGPSVEKKAAEGDAFAYNFPKSKIATISPVLTALRQQIGSDSKYSYDFSFSGIKTAVLRAGQAVVGANHELPSFKLPEMLNEAQKANIAASFQRAAIETLVDKTLEAVREFQPKSVVIGGGVAASPELRRQLAERLPFPAEYTDRKLCTDNGAMIATLGCYQAMLGQPTADPYSLEIAPNLSM
jgi:N6-L-threonylcarbamoyladenine synthase